MKVAGSPGIHSAPASSDAVAFDVATVNVVVAPPHPRVTESSTSAFVLVSTVEAPRTSCVVKIPVLLPVSMNTYVVPDVNAEPPSVTLMLMFSPNPISGIVPSISVVAPVVLAVVEVVIVQVSAVVGSMFKPLSSMVTGTFAPCVTKVGAEMLEPAFCGPQVITTVSSP